MGDVLLWWRSHFFQGFGFALASRIRAEDLANFRLRSRFLVLAALLVPVGVSLIFLEQLAPIFLTALQAEIWWIQLSRSGQNAEWLFADRRSAGSCESGEDLPIGCRNNAVEN